MKKINNSIFGFLFAFALTLSFTVGEYANAENPKIRWKVQSTFNTGWPALGDPVKRLSETLDAATDGRIQLKVYEPGKILPPLQITT